MKLLSVSSDPKTTKGEDEGYLTGILYLAPHGISGHQVCPWASIQCKSACLGWWSGRAVTKPIREARIKKTKMLFEEPILFLDLLYKDIDSLVKKACKDDMIPAVRLNGSSDLDWSDVIRAFPNVQFYDYTKNFQKYTDLKNYHLTYSASENTMVSTIKMKVGEGSNVAVVFNDTLPSTYLGITVIDGDKNDLRFLDPEGVIVGLRAKGAARKNKTGGFVK